jgi:hypothetical protein
MAEIIEEPNCLLDEKKIGCFHEHPTFQYNDTEVMKCHRSWMWLYKSLLVTRI